MPSPATTGMSATTASKSTTAPYVLPALLMELMCVKIIEVAMVEIVSIMMNRIAEAII